MYGHPHINPSVVNRAIITRVDVRLREYEQAMIATGRTPANVASSGYAETKAKKIAKTAVYKRARLRVY